MSFKSPGEKVLLQKEISPVLEAIIMKCADSNRLVDFLGAQKA